MKIQFDPGTSIKIEQLPHNANSAKKEEILQRSSASLTTMASLQDKLYAEKKEGLIIVLQAIDAAGKDSTIKHVIGGMNPAGVNVVSFKTPTSEELAHDYLWRIYKHIPARGEIAIFNRSYYEDVITVDIHDFYKSYRMSERVIGEDKEKFFRKRYKQINHFEEYLYENSYHVLKIFLNVSKETQKKRFLERLERPEKNWKFSKNDLVERKLWDKYISTFDKVLTATNTKRAPWYIVPADQKWYTRYLVAKIINETLYKIDPRYPELSDEEKAKIPAYEKYLKEEK